MIENTNVLLLRTFPPPTRSVLNQNQWCNHHERI